MARRGPSTALVDPSARATLQKAADAAGLSLEQLIELAVDSAALTGAGDRARGRSVLGSLTVRDIGQRMHAELIAHPISDRAAWFKGLLEPQQAALIVALRDKGYRTEVITNELGVARSSVETIWNRYADLVGATVVSIRLNTIAGHLQLAAERAQEGLAEKGDWKGYFAVAKDMVALLQTLGIVDSAVRRVEVTHKFDEQKRAEIDAMVELERKKEARQIELKEAEFQVLDNLPVEEDAT